MRACTACDYFFTSVLTGNVEKEFMHSLTYVQRRIELDKIAVI